MVNPSRIKEFNNSYKDPIHNFGNPKCPSCMLHKCPCIEKMPKISKDGESQCVVRLQKLHFPSRSILCFIKSWPLKCWHLNIKYVPLEYSVSIAPPSMV